MRETFESEAPAPVRVQPVVRRASFGKWRFSVWRLSKWRLSWRRDKWDAGSFAIGKRMVTYLRQHG